MHNPEHVAVVLDGNRRWAQERGLPSWEGHKAGAERLEKFMDWCIDAGVKTVSVYALSGENLRRSKKELHNLFNVMCETGEKWLAPGGLLDKYEVNVNFVGNLSRLPLRLIKIIEKLRVKTSKYSKRFLNILIGYTGKEEIANAVRNIISNMSRQTIRITPKMIEKNLYVKKPVDLVIRAGGHSRLSNFLLWQTAYAEMFVTKTLWPDFSKRDFDKAMKFYQATQRNFGY